MAESPHVVLFPWMAEWVEGNAHDIIKSRLQQDIPDANITAISTVSETENVLPTTDILITNHLPPAYYEFLDRVKWIHVISAGVDKYDLDRLSINDVILTNSSGVHAQPIAEQVIGYMIFFERNFTRAIAQQSTHRWEKFGGGEIGMKTIGILGVGAVGRRIADIASAFGMEVLGVKRDTSELVDSVDAVYRPAEFHTVLDQSDYVVIACPLTDETRGMIDSEAFVSMNEQGVLINIARGPIVDHAALVQALQNNRIGGAALDVVDPEPLPDDSPLWDLSNVFITPHMAGLTPYYWDRVAEIVSENYAKFVADDYSSMMNRVV